MKFFVLLIAFSAVNAQRFLPGPCRNIPPAENFNKDQFFGHWFETEKTPSIFDLFMRCTEVDYSDDKDGSINVVVKGVSLAGLPVSIAGDGLVQDVKKIGHYSVRYGFGVPLQGTLTTIVDTDNKEYALVYSCTNSLLNVFHSEYIWVLSRDGVLPNPTRQNLYEKLDALKINRSGLVLTDRAGCSSNITREASQESLIPSVSSTASTPLTGTTLASTTLPAATPIASNDLAE